MISAWAGSSIGMLIFREYYTKKWGLLPCGTLGRVIIDKFHVKIHNNTEFPLSIPMEKKTRSAAENLRGDVDGQVLALEAKISNMGFPEDSEPNMELLRKIGALVAEAGNLVEQVTTTNIDPYRDITARQGEVGRHVNEIV